MLHRRSATRAQPLFWCAELAAKIILLVPLLAARPAVADDVLSKVVTVSIPAQALDTALMQFSKQAHMQVMLASSSVDGKFTKGVQGTMPVGAALTIMLRDSGMSFTADNQTVTVSPIANPKHGELTDKNSSRVAQANQQEERKEAKQEPPSHDDQSIGGKQNPKATDSEERSDRDRLQEIVVTGTNIRGGESASPVLVFTPEDIAKTGAATAQEFMATLPQNFGGGQTDLTTFTNGRQLDLSYGSAINLRGLGSDSTLVLINGHRSALAGTAEYTDISAIPMSAVERIEVLTDGASAIYGSDAIAGVVNFILRKDYEGADTRVQGGTTTQGGGTEYQVAQDFGTKWDSGSALLSYEFTRREPINSSQREFTSRFSSANYTQTDYDLDPDQKTQNVYLAAQQKFGERTSISTDFLFSNRDSGFQQYDPYGADYQESYSSNQQFAGSADLAYQLNNFWQMDVTGGASRNKDNYVSTDPYYGAAQTGSSKYDIGYVDVKATGAVVELPAGPMKLAVGAGYRKESYTFSVDGEGVPSSAFNVRAEYAELLVPLMSGTQSRSASRLSLTLAARHEDYSNFGGTTNPKVGVRWAPRESVQFRGTFGTSFKAPSLFQASEFNAGLFIENATLPGGETTRYVEPNGNNPNLKPQTAKTWTFGVDFSPESIRGMTGHLTYFNVDYKGLIAAATFNPTAWLTDPAYAGIRTLRGSIPNSEFNALVEGLLSDPSLYKNGCSTGTYGYSPCTEPVQGINAIIDDRLLNLAEARTSGLDLTIDQRIDAGVGAIALNLNTSYLFAMARRYTEGAPVVELLNTVFNPVRLRLRGSATWTVGSWDITGVTNFTNKYTNNITYQLTNSVSGPENSMASWTTIDLNIRYGFGSRASASTPANTTVALNITNVFDKNPPYFADPYFPNFGYDPANANPYGRVVSIILAHKW
jgi:iron complex outermembrane receptor protein